MKDRLLSGSLAGFIAGAVMSSWNLFSVYVLHFAKSRLLDFMWIVIAGYPPKTWLQVLMGQAVHLIWLGFLGIVFAYLVPLITSRHYLYRGWYYAIITWILTSVIPVMMRVPGVDKVPWGTMLSGFIGSSAYGIVLAYVVNRLDNPKGN